MKKSVFSICFVMAFLLYESVSVIAAAKRPATMEELALYKGPDRQQILEEGAKKEGALTFYTTGILQQAVRPVVDAFQRKYPYIKVEIWRASSNSIVPRLIEEYKARRYIGDVLETEKPPRLVLQKAGIGVPFYSPNLAAMDEDGLMKAPDGSILAAVIRQSAVGLAFNTRQITKEQVPKTYEDLLDPRWKGKSAIVGSNTGQKWMEAMLVSRNEEFIRKVAQQEFAVHMVSAKALLDMIINGEYVFSPTIYDAHVDTSKRKGAPVDWIPLEPVYLLAGQISPINNAPHPHAAMLFVDFELSREGADIHKKVGYNSARKDVPGAATYKKYYGADSLEGVIERENLFTTLFLKK